MKVLGVLILFFWSSLVSAVDMIAGDMLAPPTLLLEQGLYRQAAEGFHQQANKILEMEQQLGRLRMWQTAGVAEGLAAMIAEKNRDPVAYDYWAASVKYFLLGESSWQMIQNRLHHDYEQIRTRLSVGMMPGQGNNITYDDPKILLFSLLRIWDKQLNYFRYRAPAAGLTRSEGIMGGQPANPRQSTPAESPSHHPTPGQPLNIDAVSSHRVFIAVPPPQTSSQSTSSQSPPQTTSAQPVQDETVIVSPLETKQLEGKLHEEELLETKQTSTTLGSADSDDANGDHATNSVHATNSDHANGDNVSSPTVSTASETIISRGNLAAESGPGVVATQKRGVAPQAEEK
jgi:hypothetical protein